MSSAALWKEGCGNGIWMSPIVTTGDEFIVMHEDRLEVYYRDVDLEVERMFCLFFSLYFKEYEDASSYAIPDQ